MSGSHEPTEAEATYISEDEDEDDVEDEETAPAVDQGTSLCVCVSM